MMSNKTLTREQILREYNDVFTGLGCLPGEYHLEIDKSVKPIQHQPCRVAAPDETSSKAENKRPRKDGHNYKSN